MRLSRRGSWWVETAVLFIVITGIGAATWYFLFGRAEPWAQSLLRGAVFAVGMLVVLSLQVRDRERRKRR